VVSGGTAPAPSCAKGSTPVLPPTYVSKGVDGKATVVFSTVNLQVESGSGTTAKVNGVGNVVIGYDESPGSQTGSHNLILGVGQTATSYGSILGGENNTATGPFNAVLGSQNTASNTASSVSGGELNTASGAQASISGGNGNTASGNQDSVSGGDANTASGSDASVNGGAANIAAGTQDSVAGGQNNTAQGIESSISGGKSNLATGFGASISGGLMNLASDTWGSILGGCANITGTGTLTNRSCGFKATTIQDNAIVGGERNTGTGVATAILGGHDVTLNGVDTHNP
jgi:trimeric autotransporter adhesin